MINFLYGFGTALMILAVVGALTIKWLNFDEKRVEKEKQKMRERSKEAIRVKF